MQHKLRNEEVTENFGKTRKNSAVGDDQKS
jgi:hypothetical protein